MRSYKRVTSASPEVASRLSLWSAKRVPNDSQFLAATGVLSTPFGVELTLLLLAILFYQYWYLPQSRLVMLGRLAYSRRLFRPSKSSIAKADSAPVVQRCISAIPRAGLVHRTRQTVLRGPEQSPASIVRRYASGVFTKPTRRVEFKTVRYLRRCSQTSPQHHLLTRTDRDQIYFALLFRLMQQISHFSNP